MSIRHAAIRDFQGSSAVHVLALPDRTVCIPGFYNAHSHVPTAALAEQHGFISSIQLTHRALLARGVVGYQEVYFDSPSKMAAYLQVFEGSMAYDQPRVRGLLRMRPDNSVAEIQDMMTRLQVCCYLRHPTFLLLLMKLRCSNSSVPG